MTGENDAMASPERIPWTRGQLAAMASAIIACVVLLGAVRYCPSYMAGKITLYQTWLYTFWNDLSTQIAGLFAGASKETQSGEAVASEWNYCLMVPFIAAWLVWRQVPKLRATPLVGSPGGYAILAVGFLLYIGGFLAESNYVGMGSMEFIYAGLIVLFLGWNALRLLIFPVAFLMFMWPYDFMEDVALELRLLMSSLSHHVLQFIDVPNVLQGTAIISAPGAAAPFAIDIADPCSGIRSLFALVMIAAVYSFVAFEKLWQQLIIVALAVPLVIVGNLVRIVILALGTIHFGAAFALGTNTQPSWFHEGAGYLVYLINFGGLIGIGTLLSRFTSEPAPDPAPEAPPEEHARP
jgi:exosortase